MRKIQEGSVMSTDDNTNQGNLPVSRDEKFLREVRETVEANLGNDQFGVEQLASAMAMSRIQLYRKLHRLTGKNVSQYIREIRLEKARELLRQDVAGVAEIAYTVGFGSPAYFNRCFHEYYGFTPGEVIRNKGRSDSPDRDQMEPVIEEQEVSESIPAKSFSRGIQKRIWFAAFGILLVMIFFVIFFTGRNSPATDKLEKTIAVFPLCLDEEDPENGYFCNGMADELFTQLDKISGLKVKSRWVIESYIGKPLDLVNMRRKVGLDVILTLSTLKSGNNLRITVQLIDLLTGDQTWAGTYDGDYTDKIFEFHSNTAKEIAAHLDVVITLEVQKELEKIPAQNIRAYDEVIRGEYETSLYWKNGDKKHLEIAHEHLNLALKIDPDFPLAIVQKGRIFNIEKKYDSVLIYAKKAIQVDPGINRGYNLLGDYYASLGKNDLAIKNYIRAIELPPRDDIWILYNVSLGELYLNQKNDAINALRYLQNGLELSEIHLTHIYPLIIACFMSIGNYDRAEEYIKRSLEFCNNCTIYLYASWIKQIHGEFNEASKIVNSLCQNPDCHQICLRDRFQISLLKGELSFAEQYYDKWKKSGHLWRASDLYVHYQIGYIYYKLGKFNEAEEVFIEQIKNLKSSLVENPTWKHPYYMNLARIYAFTGNHHEALKYLKKYAEIGFTYGWHDFIENDPFFESFSENPEFRTIISRARKDKEHLRKVLSEMEERGEIKL
ncbi:MAG: helix-turn-helix domain-containing protein [Cyclobacteriaceae bacterium]|nr:helix-turn-helix domain-containing protein [Cyclobacteriaceae bacterium]